MKKVLNLIAVLSVSALMFCISSNCLAKSVNLYDQPNANGKVINTVDSNTGIVTIYKPKEGDWIKVGDPRNGNVGWAKLADLKGVGLQFNIIQSGNGMHSYQLIEYDGNSTLSPEQIKAAAKQMQMQQQNIQMRQQAIQENVTKMMNDVFNTMHQYWVNLPMIMPVIIVPEKAATANPKQPPAPVGVDKTKK